MLIFTEWSDLLSICVIVRAIKRI